MNVAASSVFKNQMLQEKIQLRFQAVDLYLYYNIYHSEHLCYSVLRQTHTGSTGSSKISALGVKFLPLQKYTKKAINFF